MKQCNTGDTGITAGSSTCCSTSIQLSVNVIGKAADDDSSISDLMEFLVSGFSPQPNWLF